MAFQASGFSINILTVSLSITLSHYPYTFIYTLGHWWWCGVAGIFYPPIRPLVRTSCAHVLPMAYGLFNNECCTYVIFCVFHFLTDFNANEFCVQMNFICNNWYLIQWWLYTLPLLLINFILIKCWKIKTTPPRLAGALFNHSQWLVASNINAV